MRTPSGSSQSGDDPKLASYLRIEERELEAGGLDWIVLLEGLNKAEHDDAPKRETAQ